MKPIGFICSPYLEKFAIPRQPMLAPSAIGYCELINEAGNPDAVRELETFSHIWILFDFHQTKIQGWQALVRPPRLGGNKKVGVFASRSTFRPNSIGMSLVELIKVESLTINKKPINRLHVKGLDLVHGTPILDIKPYLPYSDSVPNALAGYAQNTPQTHLQIKFTKLLTSEIQPDLKQLIIEVLQQDPRPAYQYGQISNREYGVLLAGYNIKFTYPEINTIKVLSMVKI